MKHRRTEILAALVMCVFSIAGLHAQARRAPSSAPKIDIQHYLLQATLTPENHELKAVATITFRPMETTDVVIFELSENLSVQRILNEQGIEIEFGQDESGPGILAVRFTRPLEAGVDTIIKVEYNGGFDRDRFSRIYTRDESSAYIGMEGSYLLYPAKWFPVNRYLVDRASAEVEITVPLGMTVVGAGTQLPVVTKGITEQFGWTSKHPILPHSIVAGRYFERTVQGGNLTVICFSREEHLDAMQKNAETLAKVLEYYTRTFGASASGDRYRLVEVDDRLTMHHGSLGTVYITRRELAQAIPSVRQLARRAAYQWWMETAGTQNVEDLWLVDGLSYLSAALYMRDAGGPEAFQEELNNLAVLGLKAEPKSAVRVGLGLGYRTEGYESVVAGKGAWVLNMLRHLLGDAKFVALVQEYLLEAAARPASTSGFQKLAERIYGQELGWFIAEWIDTIGVPEFQADFVVFKTRDGFRVSGSIKQDRDLFRMPLEVEVQTRDKAERITVEISGKSTPFDINTFALPNEVMVDPSNKILRNSRDLQIAVQLSLGNDLKQRGDFVEAIRAYEAALKLNPRNSLAHFRLGEVLWEQYNLQSAANSFRDALNGNKDPKWIEVWCYIYLGKVHDILGQRQRAMAEYNKAINTKDETFGAQAEAQKWLAAPFTRERTVMDKESKQPN